MAGHPRSFKIRVPATSANIGPGFDVVGLSLSLYLNLTVTVLDSVASSSERPTISHTGEGAEEVPLDAYKNLTTRVALYVLRCNGITSFPSGLTIHVHNEIPFGRGLGSSGAAVVAGVLLGNALGHLGPPLPPVGIGHYVSFGWAKEIRAVAIVPRFELSTAKARDVLPQSYSRKDLVCASPMGPEPAS